MVHGRVGNYLSRAWLCIMITLICDFRDTSGGGRFRRGQAHRGKHSGLPGPQTFELALFCDTFLFEFLNLKLKWWNGHLSALELLSSVIVNFLQRRKTTLALL